jgi:hypothetical protein
LKGGINASLCEWRMPIDRRMAGKS